MNANEFMQSMQSLGTRYMEECTRILQRYADFVGSVSEPGRGNARLADPTDLSAMQKRYADFVVSEAPKVLARLTEANMNYYSTLADVGLRTLNGYVDSVLRTMDAAARSGAGMSGDNSALLFHGVRGQSASNAFLITNNRDEAIDVEFDIAEVHGEEDRETFKPTAKFTPDKCRLAARSERVIACTLPLSGKFAAGHRYSGSIGVVGYPEMAIRISVEVEEEAQPGTGTGGKQAATGKTGRTKAAAKKPAKKRATKKGNA